MKNKAIRISTFAMFIFSVLITVAMLTFAVLAGVIVKELPPVIGLLVIAAFFVWVDVHYLHCCKLFNGKVNASEKRKNG